MAALFYPPSKRRAIAEPAVRKRPGAVRNGVPTRESSTRARFAERVKTRGRHSTIQTPRGAPLAAGRNRHLARLRGPMLTLKINGKSHRVDADPDMPLLWVLRDLLGMNGTKFGCGVALCGACTVHLDGIPRRSCVMPVSAAAGPSITTIEGVDATA